MSESKLFFLMNHTELTIEMLQRSGATKNQMCIFLFKFNCAWFVWFGFAHQEDNNTPSSKLKNPIKIGKLHFYGIFGKMNLT